MAALPFRDLPTMAYEAGIAWWNDNVFRLAASLAFYTIFSLAPIMLLAVAVAGMVFGEEAATRQLVAQVNGLVGQEGGQMVAGMIDSLRRAGGGPLAAAVGVVSLLIGSTAVFGELQAALNKIWDVRTDPRQGVIASLAQKRLMSLVLVIGVGFLLLVSLAIEAFLAGAQELVSRWTALPAWSWQALNFASSLAITSALFMMIYKVLPDVRLRWSDVAVGGVVTALLFLLGKVLIGIYLGTMSIGSAYGAAGSFVVLLVWIYYSALISFFGAEFTQVYARRHGSGVRPEEHAVRRREKAEDGVHPRKASNA